MIAGETKVFAGRQALRRRKQEAERARLITIGRGLLAASTTGRFHK